MKKTIIFLLLAVLTLSLSACKDNDNAVEDVIYVTVYPMEYLVNQIAGDTVEVRRVPGSNTHSDSHRSIPPR